MVSVEREVVGVEREVVGVEREVAGGWCRERSGRW